MPLHLIWRCQCCLLSQQPKLFRLQNNLQLHPGVSHHSKSGPACRLTYTPSLFPHPHHTLLMRFNCSCCSLSSCSSCMPWPQLPQPQVSQCQVSQFQKPWSEMPHSRMPQMPQPHTPQSQLDHLLMQLDQPQMSQRLPTTASKLVPVMLPEKCVPFQQLQEQTPPMSDWSMPGCST